MFLILGLVFITILYFYICKEHDFFKKRGLKYLKPLPVIGTNWKPAFGFQSYFQHYQNVYNSFQDESLIGTFDLMKPVYVVRDVELIKQITIKHFDHFMDRRVSIDVKGDPVGGRLLAFMHGEEWKQLRNILTPAFTGNKMRYLFNVVNDCIKRNMRFLDEKTNKNESYEIETHTFCTRMTNDLIASTAFGLEVDSFKDENHEFFNVGTKLVNLTLPFFLKWMLFSVAPDLAKMLKLNMFDPTASDYFIAIVDDAIKCRQKNNVTRPDIIQLLIDSDVPKEAIIGQSIQFFAAGFDTSATLLQFMLYELALHPEVQEKLQKEIDEILRHLKGNPLSYDDVQNMKYMEMVIDETVRLHPALVWLERACNKEITLEDSKGHSIEINKGDHIVIPISGLHYDSNHFANPLKFDPDRFSSETQAQHNPAYMPFGMGPRKCIAGRLAILQTKIFFIHLLSKYSLETNEKTEIPIQYKKGMAFLRAANGIWLTVRPRSNEYSGN